MHIPFVIETAMLCLGILDFEHDVITGLDFENVCVGEEVVYTCPVVGNVKSTFGN